MIDTAQDRPAFTVDLYGGDPATETHPTMSLRYQQRGVQIMATTPDGAYAFPINPPVLQQEWATITFDGMNRPIDRKTEWRDVPVVTE